MILGFTVFLAGLSMVYIGVVNTDFRALVEQFFAGNIIVRKK